VFLFSFFFQKLTEAINIKSAFPMFFKKRNQSTVIFVVVIGDLIGCQL
jgi:hypothetical protein